MTEEPKKPDVATYLICGFRPTAKATATITAAKVDGGEFKLTLRTPASPDGKIVEPESEGVWNVALGEHDCVMQLTGFDDIPWEGVTIFVDQHSSFVTYAGAAKTEAIWEGRSISTRADATPKGNPKDPWPPPGTLVKGLNTKWLAPTMKAINYTAPRDGI